MPDTRWTMADARKYLADSGLQLAPGSMALEDEGAILPTRRPSAPEPDDSPVVWLRDIPQTLPASTTEAELRALIRKVAIPHGWKHYHTYNSEKSESGFPDDFLTDGRAILMWELKMTGKKPDANQEQWLSLLAHTGKVECGVKYPHDWPQIVARLTRKDTP